MTATVPDTTIREIEPDDFDTIIDLNQNALEGVGPLDEQKLAHLVDQADQALVLDDGGDIAGFVITLPPGADYESSRYEWFEKRFEEYVYLDRIVVAETHRRQGVASQLYDEIETETPVALEVYDTNDVSLAFHRSRGYEPVGELDHAGKTNLMLVKES
ncbi:GNAT family N-acetyltransferase [Aeromicrobium marinum]|uniref:GNAT family N-acetyltransferase n=1 Tax=Aeromicrobium marinum TaxID=219314 RepID=UPI0001BCE419|nr:GNAT family N-acetyltransferase [Aeromicrobium marinum]